MGITCSYNGGERGMSNIKFNKISDYRNLATLNGYKNLVNKRGDLVGY